MFAVTKQKKNKKV